METAPKEELTEEEKAEKLLLVAQLEAKIAEIENSRATLIADKGNEELVVVSSRELRQKLAEGKALKRKREGAGAEAEIKVNYLRTHADGRTENLVIELNFENTLDDFLAFYARHTMTLPPNFEETMRDIWERQYDIIKTEVEEHGFDMLLVIPGNMSVRDLDLKMTAGYEAKTHEYISMGDFKQVTTAPRLVLLHSAPELDAIPELKTTLGKKAQVFLDEGEALTFPDYEIFQRRLFEATEQHPDIKYWIWCPGSRVGTTEEIEGGGARVVNANWNGDRLDVSASDPDYSFPDLGCRLSRSFL